MGRILLATALVALVVSACGNSSDTAGGGAPRETAATAVSGAAADKDDSFLQALDIGQVPYTDRTAAVTQARALCVFLSPSNGGTYVEAIEGVRERNANYTDEQLGFFVGAGVQIYCPDLSSQLPGG